MTMYMPNALTIAHVPVTMTRRVPRTRYWAGSARASSASRKPSTSGSMSALRTSTSTARLMRFTLARTRIAPAIWARL